MSVCDEAYMKIQWIKMVFNATDEAPERSEKRSSRSDVGAGGTLGGREADGDCTIDERDDVGMAKML